MENTERKTVVHKRVKVSDLGVHPSEVKKILNKCKKNFTFLHREMGV